MSIIEEIKSNKELKSNFIKGLNKLGFPLEFKIRRILKERGYNSVQEGFFIQKNGEDEITKSYDINAFKDKSEKILKQLTINLSLQLIGDCKYSSDEEKFLFIIPDTSNPKNKLFIGPILTSFQSANYGSYRNLEVVSQFIKKYGNIILASDVKDTSKNHILNGKESKDSKIPQYERIFNIVESTILPALSQKFLRWRAFSYNNYSRFMSNINRDIPIQDFIKLQEKRYYSGNVLIPFIVTSKKIVMPIVDKKDNIVDIEEVKYFLYEHSVLKPNKYFELLGNFYDIAIFICNENYFDEFIDYIENLFEKIYKTIITNIEKVPTRLIDDFEEMKKHQNEIETFVKTRN